MRPEIRERRRDAVARRSRLAPSRTPISSMLLTMDSPPGTVRRHRGDLAGSTPPDEGRSHVPPTPSRPRNWCSPPALADESYGASGVRASRATWPCRCWGRHRCALEIPGTSEDPRRSRHVAPVSAATAADIGRIGGIDLHGHEPAVRPKRSQTLPAHVSSISATRHARRVPARAIGANAVRRLPTRRPGRSWRRRVLARAVRVRTGYPRGTSARGVGSRTATRREHCPTRSCRRCSGRHVATTLRTTPTRRDCRGTDGDTTRDRTADGRLGRRRLGRSDSGSTGRNDYDGRTGIPPPPRDRRCSTDPSERRRTPDGPAPSVRGDSEVFLDGTCGAHARRASGVESGGFQDLLTLDDVDRSSRRRRSDPFVPFGEGGRADPGVELSPRVGRRDPNPVSGMADPGERIAELFDDGATSCYRGVLPGWVPASRSASPPHARTARLGHPTRSTPMSLPRAHKGLRCRAPIRTTSSCWSLGREHWEVHAAPGGGRAIRSTRSLVRAGCMTCRWEPRTPNDDGRRVL